MRNLLNISLPFDICVGVFIFYL